MAIHITSGALTANTVSTVTFALWYRGIQVINRSANDIWARFDGVDPTVAGDECFFVPANSYISVNNPVKPPEPALGLTAVTTVKLISASASNFTIEAGV